MRWASPPGEAGRRTAQGQVPQPHVDEEAQPGIDLLEDLRGDHLLLLRQGQPGKEGPRVPDAQRGNLGQVLAPHGDGQASGFRRWPWQSGQGSSAMYSS